MFCFRRVDLDQSGRGSCHHAERSEGARHHRVGAHNAVFPQRDPGHDGGSITQETPCADTHRSLALERLRHDGSRLRRKPVHQIRDINVLAQYRTVSDDDFLRGGQVDIPSYVNSVPYRDSWAVANSGIFLNGIQISVGKNPGFVAQRYAGASVNRRRSADERIPPVRYSARTIEGVPGP